MIKRGRSRSLVPSGHLHNGIQTNNLVVVDPRRDRAKIARVADHIRSVLDISDGRESAHRNKADHGAVLSISVTEARQEYQANVASILSPLDMRQQASESQRDGFR